MRVHKAGSFSLRETTRLIRDYLCGFARLDVEKCMGTGVRVCGGSQIWSCGSCVGGPVPCLPCCWGGGLKPIV